MSDYVGDYFPDDSLKPLDTPAQTAIEDAAWDVIQTSPTTSYCPGPRKLRSILASRSNAFEELDSIYRLSGYDGVKRFASEVARLHLVDRVHDSYSPIAHAPTQPCPPGMVSGWLYAGILTGSG